MKIPEPTENAFELIAENTLISVGIGSIYGACLKFWSVQPAFKNPEFTKQLSHLAGQNAMKYGIAGFLLTSGMCAMEAFRAKKDPFNAGLGGAMVGVFIGLKPPTAGQFLSKTSLFPRVVMRSVTLGAGAIFFSYVDQHVNRRVREYDHDQKLKEVYGFSMKPAAGADNTITGLRGRSV